MAITPFDHMAEFICVLACSCLIVLSVVWRGAGVGRGPGLVCFSFQAEGFAVRRWQLWGTRIGGSLHQSTLSPLRPSQALAIFFALELILADNTSRVSFD